MRQSVRSVKIKEKIMKIIYEFEPDPEKNDDKHELELVQRASDMYMALSDLDGLKRSLYKGYKYYIPEEEEENKEYDRSKYSLIDVDELLNDLGNILVDAKYYEFH